MVSARFDCGMNPPVAGLLMMMKTLWSASETVGCKNKSAVAMTSSIRENRIAESAGSGLKVATIEKRNDAPDCNVIFAGLLVLCSP
jgi:hypothetical protein